MVMLSKSKSNPYVSFITWARNDNYGGRQSERLNISISTLLEQITRYQLPCEFILVDWNSPDDAIPLAELIDWPKVNKYCSIRSIVVPSHIHEKIPYSSSCPIAGSHAINAGIIRSRGEFILPRVSDVIYEDGIVEFLAERRLEKSTIYKTDRWDIYDDILNLINHSTEELIDFCRNNIKKKNEGRKFKPNSKLPSIHGGAVGDFILLSREMYFKIRGYYETNGAFSESADYIFCYAAHVLGINECVLSETLPVYKIDHPFHTGSNPEKIPLFHHRFLNRIFFLPTFFKKSICRLIDSFLWRTGIIKNIRIYKRNGIPLMSENEKFNLYKNIASGKLSPVFNDEHWGLGKHDLPINVISRADWESLNVDSYSS